jgi:hypothetical protein
MLSLKIKFLTFFSLKILLNKKILINSNMLLFRAPTRYLNDDFIISTSIQRSNCSNSGVVKNPYI